MSFKKYLVLFLILTMSTAVRHAQVKRIKTVEKGYPFNPDYPDMYYGEEKVFLEVVFYQCKANPSTYKARYVILFSGMTRNPDGSKKYIACNWGFNTLEEFVYHKELIENKSYYRILLKEPEENLLSDVVVLMHPKRAIPKL